MPTRNFEDSSKNSYYSVLSPAYDSIYAMMYLALNVTDYAIYTLDVEGCITSWNEGARQLTGYEYDEIFGKNYSIFFPPEDVDAGTPKEELAIAARDGRFETTRWRCRKGGDRFWALVTLTAIRGRDGQLTGFAKITRDITVQKMLEEKQKMSAQELEERIQERTSQLEAVAAELRAEKEKVQDIMVKLRRELDEKEVLLREVYHRVKNNMQVVQSLLRMGGRTMSSEDDRNVIAAAVERVHVMASVHEHLYQSGELAVLSLPKFLRGIIEGAIAANSDLRNDIQLQMEFDEVPLSIDSAIPLGLLVNELISNCLKHGLPKIRPGTIQISGRLVPGAVRLVVQDNGQGLPDDFNISRQKSMGLKLVESLARRMGGKVEYSSDHGCKVQTFLTVLCPQPGQHPVQAGQHPSQVRQDTLTQPLQQLYPELPLFESEAIHRPEQAAQAQ